MNCPVCQHLNIPSLATTCPICASNLVGIKLLDALEDQYVETVKSKVALEGEKLQNSIEYAQNIKKKTRRIRGLLFLLFLLPLLYYFFGRSEPKEIVTTEPKYLDSLTIYKDKLAEKNAALTTLNQQLVTIKETQNIKEINYVVKEGDILYDIGVLFYNDTTAWYQIALDNKIYDIKGLPVGDTLKIKFRY